MPKQVQKQRRSHSSSSEWDAPKERSQHHCYWLHHKEGCNRGDERKLKHDNKISAEDKKVLLDPKLDAKPQSRPGSQPQVASHGKGGGREKSGDDKKGQDNRICKEWGKTGGCKKG